MTAAEKERRDRIRRWAVCIVDSLDNGNPGVIIGHEIHALFFAALSDKDIADNLMFHFGKRLAADARQRCGYCQDCDAEIPAFKTTHPLCGTCEGKANANFLRFEMENPDDEDDNEPQAKPE